MRNPVAERALAKAVQVAGSATRLGAACKVTPQAVDQWLRKGQTPVSRVLCVEAFTGVPRHELRPDIYPAPSVSLAS